jgi:hypothetical protein
MVSCRQDLGPPAHGHVAQAEAPPVALGETGLVQQGWHAQPLPLGQPPGEVIDAFPEEANALRQA